jgi:hypothetical protein
MPPPKRTRATHEILPPHEPPEHATTQSSLATFRNWREGSVATAIVMAALLPFAVAWHMPDRTAIAVCLIGAAILGAGCHIACRHRLATLAVVPSSLSCPKSPRRARDFSASATAELLRPGCGERLP